MNHFDIDESYDGEGFEIPQRLCCMFGFALRDYQELQQVKKIEPQKIEIYRNRLRATNKRLMILVDDLVLPKHIYAPGL